MGLKVNPGKCDLYFTNKSETEENTLRQQDVLERFQTLAPNIKVMKDNSLTLQGAPIMDEASEEVL